MKITFLALFYFMLTSTIAAAATMPGYDCENNAGKFDQTLGLRTQEFYQGIRGCRMTNNAVFTYTVFPQVSVQNANYNIQFYSSEERVFIIRGRLSNNTTVLFTQTTNQIVSGADGDEWRRKVFTYQGGSAATDLTLNSIEFECGNTITIDNVSGTVTSPNLDTRFFKTQTGYDNLLINITLDDVLSGTLKTNEFRMEGRLPVENSAEVYALDTGLNPYVYVECSSVTFTTITVNPYDAPGSNYQIGCLPSTLTNSQRGLFWVKNIGTTPVLPVKFTISLKTIPFILDTATSSAFNFEMLLKTTTYP